MPSHTVNWEDDENNRLVELSVQYCINNDEVVVEQVTPAAITFIDAARTPTRQMKVWTDAGRRVLLRQHAQSNHDVEESIKSQLA